MGGPPTPAGKPARPDAAKPAPRLWLRLGVLLVCVIGGPLLVEVWMRFLLFHPSEFATRHGRELRDPGLFADPDLESEYWRLEWILRDTPDKHRSPPYDELLGWTNRFIEPGTYRYEPAFEPAGRRPVVMYGASFVDCVTGPEECFQTLLEESDLGRGHVLYNLGVGGHGCGQTLTLMRATLDRFEGRDPVVVIGLVADSDFRRASVEFRSWPKLKLVRRAGELVPEGPVPSSGAAAYIEQHGTGIRSYAWRYLLHAPSQIPVGWQRALRGADAAEAEQNELILDIARAMRDEVEGRGYEYFFMLFTSRLGLPPAATPEHERMLLKLFEDEGMPHISARRYLRRATRDTGVELDDLFIPEGLKRNHPNLAGNRVLFEALARGLSGEFEPPRERAGGD